MVFVSNWHFGPGFISNHDFLGTNELVKCSLVCDRKQSSMWKGQEAWSNMYRVPLRMSNTRTVTPLRTTCLHCSNDVFTNGSSTLVSYGGVKEGGGEGLKKRGLPCVPSLKPRSSENGNL